MGNDRYDWSLSPSHAAPSHSHTSVGDVEKCRSLWGRKGHAWIAWNKVLQSTVMVSRQRLMARMGYGDLLSCVSLLHLFPAEQSQVLGHGQLVWSIPMYTSCQELPSIFCLPGATNHWGKNAGAGFWDKTLVMAFFLIDFPYSETSPGLWLCAILDPSKKTGHKRWSSGQVRDFSM